MFIDFIKRVLKQVWSLLSDQDWDADLTKVAGVVLMAIGVVGWWYGKADFQWIVGVGAGMASTGKVADVASIGRGRG